MDKTECVYSISTQSRVTKIYLHVAYVHYAGNEEKVTFENQRWQEPRKAHGASVFVLAHTTVSSPRIFFTFIVKYICLLDQSAPKTIQFYFQKQTLLQSDSHVPTFRNDECRNLSFPTWLQSLITLLVTTMVHYSWVCWFATWEMLHACPVPYFETQG